MQEEAGSTGRETSQRPGPLQQSLSGQQPPGTQPWLASSPALDQTSSLSRWRALQAWLRHPTPHCPGAGNSLCQTAQPMCPTGQSRPSWWGHWDGGSEVGLSYVKTVVPLWRRIGSLTSLSQFFKERIFPMFFSLGNLIMLYFLIFGSTGV